MARDLNRVMLIWRLTQDIDVKKLPETWRSVATFTIATNRRYKNQEGQVIEEAEFHRCVAFWQAADILGQYLSKWRRVYIEWRLRTRKWEDSTGQIRYTTEIIVEDFIFLDSKWSSDNVTPSSSWKEENESPILDTEDEEIPF